MAITADELVKDIAGLVTLPDVFLRISRLIDDPNSASSDIARAVSRDPSFTLRLLRVANSSLYSFASPVTTVAKAVSIIGTAQVRSLALSMSVAKTFAGLSNELVSMANFWRHSLYCALIARSLAKLCRGCDPDTLFTAGLLHDIGELVIFNRLPRQAEEALLMALDSLDQIQIHEAEQQVMGLDHAAVGGALARLWHIPAQLAECIEFHHDIAGARDYPRETAVIHLANVLALMAEVDSLDPADVSPIAPRAWALTGLGEDCIAPIVREAREEIAEAEQLFTE